MANSDKEKQHSAEYNALTAINQDLCNALPIDDLLPTMISKRVISFRDKDEIRSERTDRDKVDLFISKLTGELISGENERFYKFINVMKGSPKCNFLVKRMEGWISHYKSGTPPPGSGQSTVTASSQQPVTKPASQQSPVTISQQHDTTTSDGHPIKDAKLLHKHVIPRISAEWQTVAAYLEYSIATKKTINKANRGLPRDCCTELLEDWISSDNGVKPKTWEKLIEVLSEISSLAMVTKEIKQCLYEEGVLGGQRSPSQQHQMISHPPLPTALHQQPHPADHLDVEKRLELQKEAFTSCRQYIVDHLSPDDVVDHLISQRLIGDSAREQLSLSIKTTKEKNRIIVDELCTGGPGTLEKFCAMLKKSRRTKHIADHLDKEWSKLLQSSQDDSEQIHHSPPVHPTVPTVTAQANTVTAASEQGQISAPSGQSVAESHECSDDLNNDDQEVTSPVSESDEGYFYSTGINLDQDEDEGSLSDNIPRKVEECPSPSCPPPTTTITTAVTTPINVTTTPDVTMGAITATMAAMRPGNVTTTSSNAAMTMPPGADHVTMASDNVATTTVTAPDDVTHGVTTTVTDDDSLVTGKDSKRCMRLMQRYIIPKISDEWEAVAAFLDYSIQAKNDIAKDNNSPRECCKALLEDWVTTDNGAKPKTWNNLIDILSEIEELQPVMDEIKQNLIEEGVTLVGTTEGSPAHPPDDLAEQSREDDTDQQWNQQPRSSVNAPQGDVQYGLTGHPSYDLPSNHLDKQGRPMVATLVPHLYDRALHDQQWNQQPQSSVNAPQDNVQYELPHHPSYALPSNVIDEHGRPIVANLVPPSYDRPPHAIILYAKEASDPNGEQVLSLSNLLNDCGVYCDIDLYHLNENITEWSHWVGNNLNNCYIIIVCSPTMISTLEGQNERAHIEMVAANINAMILKQYLQQGAANVLPLFINNTSPDHVPPSLADKNFYHFPYDKLSEMPEDILAYQVLDHDYFTSLKNLFTMLNGQQEIPVPDDGQVAVGQYGGAPPTEYSTDT